MKALLAKIVRLGVTPEMPPLEQRFVIFTNQAALLVALLTCVGGWQPLVMRVPALHWALVAQSLVFLTIPFLMASRRIVAVTLFFALFASFSIAAIALLTGVESDQPLFLLTVVIAAWFVVPPAQQWIAYLASTLSGALLLALEVLHPSSMVGASREDMVALQFNNHIILFLIVLGFGLYSYRRTNEAEARVEEARMKSEQLLLNVLPAPIAERLKQKRGSIAERFDEATILFADIVNFTVLSEQMPPVELVRMLDDVFSRFDELAGQHGLEKIKTIGDAYMVASGIPEPRADHVEAVAAMALEMLEVVQQLPEAQALSLSIRIGIHTGPVVAGVIGQRRFAYDLWGDSVNTASRMESHGQPGRIHVSSAVYERLKDRFVLEPRGNITVKGKGELFTYFLVGRAGAGARGAEVA